MIKIDIKELIELKEKGKTYEEILEFYKNKGIKISRSTVYNRLKEYYESQGKKVNTGRPIINISIEELAQLKEQGKTHEEISELYKAKGVQISSSTVYNKLKEYYESQGKEIPKGEKKNKTRINISIEELVELKEKGKSYQAISELYKSKGIQISTSTIIRRLKAHYESQGKKVPGGANKGRPIINISIEELAQLKEQGKTHEEISEFYKNKGMQISASTIIRRLKAHYESQGKKVPRESKKSKPRINISIEELVELKEKGKSYQEISEFYKNKGMQISTSTIIRRLKAHYESQGKKVPKGSKKSKPRINISIEELVELKEQGKTYAEISELYKTKGVLISTATIGNRLKTYYEVEGKKVPRSNSSDIGKVKAEELIRLKDKGKTLQQISGYYRKKGINISSQTISKKIKEYKLEKAREKRENIDRELKNIILNGESIRVYCQRNKCPEKEEEFKERIKRLKIIASKAIKQRENYAEDKDFLEVLTILENPTIYYPANRYSIYIKPYIENGICKNGKIDLIYMRVFNNNKDLMCYILSAFKLRYDQEYDNRVWERFKANHEAKIDKYIGRLHAIEEKRSMTAQKKSKKTKEFQDIGNER